jgi:hypothetical protein
MGAELLAPDDTIPSLERATRRDTSRVAAQREQQAKQLYHG